MTLHHLIKDLQRATSGKKAKSYKKFFNEEYTDKRDRFIGVSLPDQRIIAKRHPEVTVKDLQKLLNSDIHEHRMIAGIIIVNNFRENPSEELVQFYLKNLKRFNNWDLIDNTAPKILGKYLLKNKSRRIIYELSNSKNLWEKRAAIVSTYPLIKNNEFKDTLKISKNLMKDKHHLTNKAIGWMLREVGKKDKKILTNFLKQNYKRLPRVTLRYAIERFPEEERKKMLQGEFI